MCLVQAIKVHAHYQRTCRWPVCLFVLFLLGTAARGDSYPPQDRRENTNSYNSGNVHPDVNRLEPAAPVRNTISSGEPQSYQITLVTGQYLRVTVLEVSVDVTVIMFDPEGKQVALSDDPDSVNSTERISAVANVSGNYQIQIRCVLKSAKGDYEIKVDALRSATAHDETSVKAEQAFGEAEQLRSRGSAEALHEALRKYESAVTLWQGLQDDARQAIALYKVGRTYGDLGESQTALKYYDLALALARPSGDQLTEANVLNDQGKLYSDMGWQQKALEYFSRALGIWRALKNSPGEVATLNNVGSAYYNLGETREALAALQTSLKIIRAMGNIRAEAQGLYRVGMVYGSLGESKIALDYYSRSLALMRTLGDHRGTSITLNNIGNVYYDLGDARQALSYYLEALKAAEEMADQRQQARVLSGLGNIYVTSGRLQEALDVYERAIRINRKWRDRAGEVETLYAIGTVYISSGNSPRALEYLNQALTLSQEISDRRALVRVRFSIAQVERARGDLDEARRQVEAALLVVDSLRTKIGDIELRSTYFASVQKYYEFYIDLLMRLHRERPSEGFEALALQASERARARSFLEMLTEAQVNIHQGVAPELIERERSLQQLISEKVGRQSRLLKESRTEGEAAALAKEIGNLTTQYQELATQIRRQSPRYFALTQPQFSRLDEIQEQLVDENTILLEYWLGTDRSFLWAVTPTSIKAYELPGRAEIETTARNVYELWTTHNLARSEETPGQRQMRAARAKAQYFGAASRLSNMLIGPVAEQLGTRRLLIVTQGALQFVPFGALPAPTSSNAGDADVNAPLILQHEIVYLPSASVIAALRRETAGRKSAPKSIAVLADPVFAKSDPRVNISGKRSDASASSTETIPAHLRLPHGSRTAYTASLRRLLSTRWEAQQIAQLVPKGDSMLAFDFAADRATAMSPELSQYRIIHFATHAIIDNANPEMSGIALSSVRRDGSPQDGFLQMDDIFNLSLPSELVILSACQTGLGREVKGEGVIGLTRGFMYAGARRVVVSLWSVDDRATAELMVTFYKKMLIDGLSPASALRAAQVEMWKDKRWQHPYYWAAFILQGEWE